MGARRSSLFCPSENLEMMRKAVATDADVVNYDLEDSIALDAKDTARETLVKVLPTIDREGTEIAVRINPITREGPTDVAALSAADLDLDILVVPKIELTTIDRLAELIADADLDVDVSVSIETATALRDVNRIARSDVVDAIGLGAEDLRTDVGMEPTDDDRELQYARGRIVVAGSAAGVRVSDTVYTDIDDLDGLAAVAKEARRMGFDGKSAIHPAQIPIINDAFTPDEESIAWARRVVDAAGETDAGVFQVDGEMIDEPVIQRARGILQRARAAGVEPSTE